MTERTIQVFLPDINSKQILKGKLSKNLDGDEIDRIIRGDPQKFKEVMPLALKEEKVNYNDGNIESLYAHVIETSSVSTALKRVFPNESEEKLGSIWAKYNFYGFLNVITPDELYNIDSISLAPKFAINPEATSRLAKYINQNEIKVEFIPSFSEENNVVCEDSNGKWHLVNDRIHTNHVNWIKEKCGEDLSTEDINKKLNEDEKFRTEFLAEINKENKKRREGIENTMKLLLSQGYSVYRPIDPEELIKRFQHVSLDTQNNINKKLTTEEESLSEDVKKFGGQGQTNSILKPL